MGISEQATITAVVRDAAGNLVKNKTVTFSLTDVTGGTLSVASAITNSQGRAQTVYTAGARSAHSDGVLIRASVAGAGVRPHRRRRPDGRAEGSLHLPRYRQPAGEPNAAQYKITFVIQLTDANGNGVANVPVTTSVLDGPLPKGLPRVPGGSWANYGGPVDTLPGRGYARVRHLAQRPAGSERGLQQQRAPRRRQHRPRDAGAGHDQRPGLRAGRRRCTRATRAYWLDVTLEARAAVQGTEFRRTSRSACPARVGLQHAEQCASGPHQPVRRERAAESPTDARAHHGVDSGRPRAAALFGTCGGHARQANIFLIGPMGSGKTAVGRQLARMLRVPFIDSDAEIEHAPASTSR